MHSDLFSVVGAGSLGASLCRALVEKGFQLDQLISRNEAVGHALLVQLKGGRLSTRPVWENLQPQTIFIAVPDDQIECVAERIAAEHGAAEQDGKDRASFKGITFLHTSGVHNRFALRVLAERGASVGSFHPLQTFLGSETASTFQGITIGIEGDDKALEVANSFVNALAAQSVTVPSSKKTLYHAAAVLAGNAATTLMAISEEVWTQALGSQMSFREAMAPLVRASVENALIHTPAKGLTGPVSRGDVHSIERHLQAFSDNIPQLTAFYSVLTTETVHLATRSGKISPEKAVELLDIIHDHLSRLGIQD